MKKIILVLIAVVALTASQLAYPASDSVEVGQGAEAASELTELGPIELIAHQYIASQQANCTEADESDPSLCIAIPTGVPGFAITGATTASCTTTGGWSSIYIVCIPQLFFSVQTKVASQNDPCAGIGFTVMTLTNPGGHTLQINITGDGTDPCGV